MKIVTVLGTRPEIIRLSLIIAKLDRLSQHILVHTGQNFDPNLNDIFFDQLKVRKPDYFLDVKAGSFAVQAAQILERIEKVLIKESPDKLLILGDTNSGLSAVIAKRMNIPVYHMEAGNRCYDDRVPEEVNRRIIDHCSDILMPYTERSRFNLLREGLPGNRIFVTGNPIFEVLNHFHDDVEKSNILTRLNLTSGKYFLVTMHRAENVDVESRLRSLVMALNEIQKEYGYPVVCSLHPRTKDRMAKFGLTNKNNKILFLPPLGFFDFIALERKAFCVLSDSGTVQEESCIFRVANVTIRDVTERPETIEAGSNILSGCEPDAILNAVRTVISQGCDWAVPPEYLVKEPSRTVLKVLTGYYEKRI